MLRCCDASTAFSQQKAPARLAGASAEILKRLFAIIADGFDRASFFGFLAQRLFFGGGWLFIHVRIAAVFIAREIRGSRFPAQIAINALVIDVILPAGVFWVTVRDISHINQKVAVSL
jgi:hypothetical protein